MTPNARGSGPPPSAMKPNGRQLSRTSSTAGGPPTPPPPPKPQENDLFPIYHHFPARMNVRLLIPCAGLAGGILTGWLTRPDQFVAAPADAGRVPALPGIAGSSATGAAESYAPASLSEL